MNGYFISVLCVLVGLMRTTTFVIVLIVYFWEVSCSYNAPVAASTLPCRHPCITFSNCALTLRDRDQSLSSCVTINLFFFLLYASNRMISPLQQSLTYLFLLRHSNIFVPEANRCKYKKQSNPNPIHRTLTSKSYSYWCVRSAELLIAND